MGSLWFGVDLVHDSSCLLGAKRFCFSPGCFLLLRACGHLKKKKNQKIRSFYFLQPLAVWQDKQEMWQVSWRDGGCLPSPCLGGLAAHGAASSSTPAPHACGHPTVAAARKGGQLFQGPVRKQKE